MCSALNINVGPKVTNPTCSIIFFLEKLNILIKLLRPYGLTFYWLIIQLTIFQI